MRDTLVEAINSYATARASGDQGLVKLAGNQLNALLEELFAQPKDEGPMPPEEEMTESINLDAGPA